MPGLGAIASRLGAAMATALPGENAQNLMRPLPVSGPPIARPPLPEHYQEAAVLVLLYPNSSAKDPWLTLIKRPNYDGVHAGQISLPGGRRKSGETLAQTAIRETQEEIGVDPEQVTLIGGLSPFYVAPSNHQVYPFVGFAQARPRFQPCAVEVAELIEQPLAALLDPANRRQEVRDLKRWGRTLVPYFAMGTHKVWGATAMMLSEFVELAREL